MTPKHILAMFAVFGDAYPNWKIGPTTMKTWTELTRSDEPGRLLKAAIHYARTSEYPPTVGAIRKLAAAGDKLSAEEAWEKLKLGEPAPNASAKRAIRAIGNPFAQGTHCGPSAKASEMGTLRAHFRDAYEAFEDKRDWQIEEEEIESLESFNKADLLEMDRRELAEINGERPEEVDGK